MKYSKNYCLSYKWHTISGLIFVSVATNNAFENIFSNCAKKCEKIVSSLLLECLIVK